MSNIKSVLAKCTDSNGDELDSCPVCDDPDDLECFPNLGGCPVDDSMYNYHDFNENDDGMVTAQVVPQEAQKGRGFSRLRSFLKIFEIKFAALSYFHETVEQPFKVNIVF